jgi:hypothetical protein
MQEVGIAEARKPLQRITVVALGWILVIGGIAGLFLPFVPGAVLIVSGALMLRPQHAWLRRALEECRVRFPVLGCAFARFSAGGGGWHSRFRNNPGDSGSQFKV